MSYIGYFFQCEETLEEYISITSMCPIHLKKWSDGDFCAICGRAKGLVSEKKIAPKQDAMAIVGALGESIIVYGGNSKPIFIPNRCNPYSEMVSEESFYIEKDNIVFENKKIPLHDEEGFQRLYQKEYDLLCKEYPNVKIRVGKVG